jgi:hypothetical protein
MWLNTMIGVSLDTWRPLADVGKLGMLRRPNQRFLRNMLGMSALTGQPQGIAQRCGGALFAERPHHGGLQTVHRNLPLTTR